jgi:hypothetical protein
VVGTLVGSPSSSLLLFNTYFTTSSSNIGITGSSTGVTLGGCIYIGSVTSVDVDTCGFQFVTSVGSGGGLYVLSTSSNASVWNCVFNSIAVSNSGGM